MTKIYARPLEDLQEIGHFLKTCLNIKAKHTPFNGIEMNIENISEYIRKAQSEISHTNQTPTLNSQRNRFPKYRDDEDRKDLRAKILDELIQLDAIENDDAIELGIGGAKPKGILPKAEKKAYFVIGLPASGKSTIVTSISNKLGAMILDSDFAKRKLPEYNGTPAGANMVHTESAEIVFGGHYAEPSLLKYCLSQKFNLVIPRIGHDYSDLIKFRNEIIDEGYETHLTVTTLTREYATLRALDRALTTNRYIPLGMIFDGYSNDAILNYYKARVDYHSKKDTKWKSFGAINTHKFPISIEDSSSNENPACLIGF